MGEMRGWIVAGIMEEMTLFPCAESVQGWKGVAVCVGVFRGGKRVARPEETWQGRRWWWWTFPW